MTRYKSIEVERPNRLFHCHLCLMQRRELEELTLQSQKKGLEFPRAEASSSGERDGKGCVTATHLYHCHIKSHGPADQGRRSPAYCMHGATCRHVAHLKARRRCPCKQLLICLFITTQNGCAGF